MRTFELYSMQGLWYTCTGSQQRFLLKGINWFGCGMHFIFESWQEALDL